MVEGGIVLIGKKSPSTKAIYHALASQFEGVMVVIEKRERAVTLLTRRIRRLGLLTVIGQLFFQVIIVNILKIGSLRRVTQIKEEYRLREDPIPSHCVSIVYSVNSPDCIEFLKRASPSVVVVSGTRIISKQVLSAIRCRFVNIHSGITPQYRGVHGMYWALSNGDFKSSGVTLHLIDSGIDTGEIISQKIISPTKSDNFVTYPLLQLGEGIILLINALYTGIDNNGSERNDEKGKLWYHPTAWHYVSTFLWKGIK
ncbi:MAG: formyl transferase [Cyclobacteriaceae bacterium]